MVTLDARKSGPFKIGGDIEIHRLGFGAMRVTGPRIWGPPLDRAEAVRTLKRLPELGVDFVDTADSTGRRSLSSLSTRRCTLMTASSLRPRLGCGDLVPVHGMGRVGNTCANRPSKAGNGSGLSRSDSGSYTASIRECLATSSSAVKSLQDDGSHPSRWVE